LSDKHLVFAVPGRLETPTGGYVYDRRVIAELRREGWRIDLVTLSERFPDPDATVLRESYAQLAALPPGVPLIVDGLALGVLPEIGRHLGEANPLIALVHHPLALETGLSPERAIRLHDSEMMALACARHVVTTSITTAAVLASDYGVEDGQITIAPPGTDPAAAAKGNADGIVHLLSVGAIVPRKGHDLLVAALGMLKDLPWRLTIVGDITRDAGAVMRLRGAIGYLGLDERVAVLGAVSDETLATTYESADLFVLPSHYEGYGMVFTEAVARGLPVIGTTAGAIPEAVPQGAGILVPPGGMPALVGALRDMIADTALRERYAANARQAAAQLPRWSDTAALVARAIAAVSP
jgi:glycosyltransferase involved in cell wall biosynthesis